MTSKGSLVQSQPRPPAFAPAELRLGRPAPTSRRSSSFGQMVGGKSATGPGSGVFRNIRFRCGFVIDATIIFDDVAIGILTGWVAGRILPPFQSKNLLFGGFSAGRFNEFLVQNDESQKLDQITSQSAQG